MPPMPLCICSMAGLPRMPIPPMFIMLMVFMAPIGLPYIPPALHPAVHRSRKLRDAQAGVPTRNSIGPVKSVQMACCLHRQDASPEPETRVTPSPLTTEAPCGCTPDGPWMSAAGQAAERDGQAARRS